MSIFDKYIKEGITKIGSFNKRLSNVESILLDLRKSLEKQNIRSECVEAKSNKGIGYQLLIIAEYYKKDFISVTLGSDEEEVYFLEYNGDVIVSQSIDELVEDIGNIVSSSSFWQELNVLKSLIRGGN